MADVSAKDGSQETLVNLTALICSLIIVPLVSDNQLYELLSIDFSRLIFCPQTSLDSIHFLHGSSHLCQL